MGAGLGDRLTGDPRPTSRSAGRGGSPLGGLRAALRALGLFVATVAGAAGLALLLVHLAPGDAIDLIPEGEAIRSRLEAEFHLDQPLVVRWAGSMARLAQGDLGTSVAWRPGADVWEVLRGPATRSLGWLVAATALSFAQALALAAWTAGRPTWVRGAVRLLSVAPIFLAAHLLVSGINEATFAAMGAGWIERPSWFALPDQPSAVRSALAIAILAVASGGLTELHLELEGALQRVLGSGYVDATRARGLPVWPHVWRNLAPQAATAVAGRVAFFVGGLVILERVLLLNGAGAALWQAALLRDHPVAVGVAVLSATVVAGARLAADLLRLAIDPRLRALETT